MAVLDEQQAEIPLNGGMDTSAGAEFQAVTTLRQITDLHWGSDGELEKRPATATTATPVLPTSSPYALNGIDAVATRGDEVFAITGNHGIARLDSDGTSLLYARRNVTTSTTPDAALRCSPVSATVSRRFLDRAQLSKDQQGIGSVASAVYNSETLVVAWISWTYLAATTLYVKAYDLATGTLTMEEQTTGLGTGAYLTQINAIELTEVGKEGVLISVGVLTAAPVTIRSYRWDAATNDVVADADLTTNAASVKHCLAASDSNRFYFGFQDNTSGFLTVQDRSTTTVTTTHTGNHGSIVGVSVVKGPTRTLIASIDGSTSVLGANLYAEVFGTPASVALLTTVTGTAGTIWLSGCSIALETRTDATNGAVVFAYGTDMTYAPVSVSTTSPRFTKYHHVDFTTTTPVDQSGDWIPNAACIGAATVNGRAHGVFALNPDRMQTTPVSLVVARMSCPIYATSGRNRQDIVARVCHERFSQYLLEYMGDSDSVSVVGSTMHFVMTADPQNTKPQTMFHASVSISEEPAPYVDMGNGTTLIAGGALHSYDGQLPGEAGFVDKPTVYLDDNGAGAGSLTGTFSVIAVYSKIDSAGQLHRSAPSARATITLAAARLDAYVSAVPFTAYDGDTAPLYNVELYITAAGGSTYYRANTSTDYTTWDASDSRGTFFKFTTVGAGSSTYPAVYTTGASGEPRPATPPPAFCAMVRIGDILWGINAEERSEIWHSKPLVVGYAPEWSNLNKVYIGDIGVGISDVGGMPAIFGKRGIWLIPGPGPNANGVGSFDPARRLHHEVECLHALSVCKTPAGVVFRSRKGVTLLDNGMQLQPIGHSIDASLLTSGTTTGYCKIVFDELSDELHVLDFDDSHYVMNMGEGKWSQYSQTTAFQYWKDACIARGRVYIAHSNTTDSVKRIKGLDEASYNSHTLGWSIETPWIRFDGVTGNLRVWETIPQIRLGGAVADTGSVTCTYETRDADEETFTFTAANIIAMGSVDQTVNLRCRIKNQKTRQFKMTVTEGTPGAATTGHVPVAMRVLYGVTPGGQRNKTTTQNKGGT